MALLCQETGSFPRGFFFDGMAFDGGGKRFQLDGEIGKIKLFRIFLLTNYFPLLRTSHQNY